MEFCIPMGDIACKPEEIMLALFKKLRQLHLEQCTVSVTLLQKDVPGMENVQQAVTRCIQGFEALSYSASYPFSKREIKREPH